MTTGGDEQVYCEHTILKVLRQELNGAIVPGKEVVRVRERIVRGTKNVTMTLYDINKSGIHRFLSTYKCLSSWLSFQTL